MLGSVAGPKQVDLGEENLLYFNEQLGCWVERGKEDEVAQSAAAAPPPMAASFSTSTAGGLSASTSFSDASDVAASAGGSRSETPVTASPAAGAPGMGLVPGGPPGGNMFRRETSRGARSRYVDTLNPGMTATGPPAATPPLPGGAPGGGAPKPKYTVFVPQAQTQQQQQQQQPQDPGAAGGGQEGANGGQ